MSIECTKLMELYMMLHWINLMLVKIITNFIEPKFYKKKAIQINAFYLLDGEE